MKKIIHSALWALGLFVIAIIFSSISNVFAATERNGDQFVTKSWLENSKNQEINGNVLQISEVYTLNYEWGIPDNTFKKGDTLDFSIPKEFIVNDVPSFTVNENGNEVGRVKILGDATNGFYYHLEFTTNYIETHSAVSGQFDISVSLNTRYVKENEVVEIIYPDKVVKTDVKPESSSPGGGSNGNGAGQTITNKKIGQIETRYVYNPKTGAFDKATRVVTWQVCLGKKTLLGKAKSFDEIESIEIEDNLENQKLIAMKEFDENWPDAFGWRKAFYSTSSFDYNDIPENEMGLIYQDGKDYSSNFKIDILPYVKEYDQKGTAQKSAFEEFRLEYYSVPIDLDDVVDDQEFFNDATVTIHYKNRTDDQWKLEDTVIWNTASGSANGKTAGVEFIKVDADSSAPLKGATFDLYKYNSQGVANKIKSNLSSDSNGKVQVKGLTTGDYYFLETNPPEGYEISTEKKEFKIETKDLVASNQQVKYKKLDNYNNQKENKKINVSVTKKWDDQDDKDGSRPGSIQVQLYANGKKSGQKVTLNEANQWSHTWEDLNEKENGKLIDYTVKEVETPSGYVSNSTKNKDGNIVITNSHSPELTSVKGTKEWDDKEDQDGKRPNSITVNLLANGKKIDEKVVTAADNWSYEFTDLKKYEKGKLIQYTVTENGVPDYSTKIKEYNIINSYTPSKTSVTVTKAWDDGENQDGKRPTSIRVQLYADNQKSGEAVTLSEANKWTHTWQDLDEKKNGKLINYTVREDGILDDYQVIVDNEDIGNITLTNKHTPEMTSVKGAKIWDDNQNQDGKRPDSITVNLLADGKKVDEKVVTKDNNWQYEFTDLAKYKEGKLIEYLVTENNVEDYSTQIKQLNLVNSYTPQKTSVTVTKAWDDGENQDGKRPTSIKVQLYANGEKSGDAVALSEANQWRHTWLNLDEKSDGKTINYTVKEEGTLSGYEVVVNEDNIGNILITNKYTPEMTSVQGVKQWNDHDNQDGKRPNAIKVNLLADGKKIDEKVVTEANNWSYEFKDLPKYDNGQIINYSVTENAVNDYSTEIKGNDLVNNYTPAKTSVTVTKAWNDKENQDGKRPNSIKVQLYADGKKSGGVVTLNEANHWSHTWQDLDEKASGKRINYTVKEEGVPSGYEVVVNDDDIGNIIITNDYTPEKTSIKGSKVWNDHDNQDGKRPDFITVNLLANGKKIAEKIVTEKDNWKYEFINLPKYADGQLINYSVTENDIDDYSTKIKGFNIINNYTPAKTSVTVTKAWQDHHNQDGKRPASINVQLYADGEISGDAITLNETNHWTHTWQDLDEKKSGKDIKYTVKEEGTPSGYDVVVDDENIGNILITNNYTPEITSIAGAKEWNDYDNQDGKRPESITVNLLANGQKIDEKKVTEKDDWKYEFTNLPKYEDGQLISYSVTENENNDYSTEIKGHTILNNYTPAKTSVTVTKAWQDGHNQDGKRPMSIKVQLYADGEKSGNAITLSEANNWTHTWQDLDEKKNGNLISYSVKEEEAPSGYDVVVNNQNNGNIIITNTYTPETTSVTGAKLWEDHENQDGKRPDSITVNLLANGKKIDEKVVTKDDNWGYEFTNLPKYEAGQLIEYAVTENDITDYSTEINGYNIVNSYTPKKTSVTVTKTWNDSHDQDGKRPNSINVQLYADGEKSGETITLSEANKWTHTWQDLDEKKNGKDISYTVKEEETPSGYDLVINDEDKGNIILTNTHIPEITSINGTKTWNDQNNQDGKRPESITVNLLANGTKIDEKIVSSDTNWQYEFTNLPKYEAGQLIEYSVTENNSEDYSTDVHGFDIENNYTPAKTSVTVTKAWQDHNDQDGKRPANITVQLYADGEKLGETITLSEANKWTHTWQDLDEMKNGNRIRYTVEEEGVHSDYDVSANNDDIGNIILTNVYTPEVTEIRGSKQWDDKGDQDGKRPEAITVNLLANGKKVDEKIITEKDNWRYEFTNLPKYEAGKLIDYKVTENSRLDYSTDTEGHDLINRYTPDKTSVTVTKAWEDYNNQDGRRPETIAVQLYADDKKSGDVVILSDANKWSHTWQNLDEKKNGRYINYTVKEEGVPSGYEVVVNDEDKGNIIITNNYTPEITSISGVKTWNDHNNQDGKRPESITVNLLANGKKVAEKAVTEKEGWKYEFTNLPKYADGQEINYRVTENDVDDYSTDVNGFDIVNSYTPGKTSVTVTKAWEDHSNQDGKRPTSINIQLYADGEKSGDVVTLNEANEWTYTWQDLDEKKDGKAIGYTVKEEDAPSGYEVAVDDGNIGNIIVTNTHVPEITSIKGTKTWDDHNNQAGKRPNSIAVNLLADGKKIDERVITEKDNWTYEFVNLPKYASGKEVIYTVTEDKVDGYIVKPDGVNVINTYNPDKTSLSVTKAWEDNHDQDGIRPEGIKVQLYADGKKTGDVVTLNEQNKWTHVWSDLEKKDGSKEIKYTVKEIDVPDKYKSTITEKNGNVTITNTHTSKDISHTNHDNTGILPKAGEKLNDIVTLIGVICLLPVVLYVSTRKKDN